MSRNSKSENKQTRLRRIIRLIAILRSNKWTIKQLCERLEATKSTIYRDIELLEDEGFYIDKDDFDRHFIASTENDPIQTHFTIEEASAMRKVLQTIPDHPLRDSMLKKLSILSEMGKTPEIFFKAHIGEFVEQLNQAMRNKNQVILKDYCSASSNDIRDRHIEPIDFCINYGMIVAYDVEDQANKKFKLDRIREIEETHRKFQYEHLHKVSTTDIFGLSGENETMVKLTMKLRPYLLLQEEYPLSNKYLSRENGLLKFEGPVTRFEGVGRFVLGLISDIESIEPAPFREYLLGIVTEAITKLSSAVVGKAADSSLSVG